LIVGTALSVAAMTLLNGAPPAHAVLGANNVAVTAAGSDTTEGVMNDIMLDLDNRPFTINGVTQTVRTFNIPASPTAYTSLPSNQYAVPGDTECSDVNWVKDPAAPSGNTALATGQKGTAPFGSSAGRNYLATENSGTGPNPASGTETTGQGFGCIDVARSSGAPRASGAGDKATFEYYAFAMDALSWATLSLKAPGALTHQQIKDIYLCHITDWATVGGTPGPIVRYLPQPGSGTRSFFISDILGGVTPDNTGACAGGGDRTLHLVEENQAQTVTAADLDKAIFPYSAALWDFQTANAINPTLDRRCPSGAGTCARLGGMITTGGNVNASPVFWQATDHAYELDTAGVVTDANVKQNGGFNEATGSFIGIRYVYNVLDSVGSGGRAGYQGAVQLLGFTNSAGGTKGPLCANNTSAGATEKGLILTAGFAPLNTTFGSSTSNKAGSTCRFFQGVN
jgi:ABC-type phosphate transport system substrate-binding protein